MALPAIAGKVGQLRFCMRSDLGADAYGACEVEELKNSNPDGCDILMVVKRRMADSNPSHVKCLLSANRCAELRLSFRQPSGIAQRRPVGDSVKRNIKAFAPRCKEQGILSSDGAAFLQSWAEGQWPLRARPVSYSFLENRHPSPLDVFTVDPAQSWQQTAKTITFNLRARDDDTSSASEDDLAPICDAVDPD